MTRILLNIRLESLKQSMFGRMKRDNKKMSKLVKGLIVLLAIYVVVALGTSLTFTFSMLADSFLQFGFGWLYFALLGIITTCLSLISTVVMSNSQIFDAKDNDLLLSMPIKPGAILASRILIIALLNFAYAFVIGLCAEAVFIAKTDFDIVQVLVTFIAVVLISVMATALGCACGWLIGLVLSRTSAKNIIITVMSLVFLFGYMFIFMNLQGNMTALIAKGEALATAISSSLPPFYHFGVACFDSSLASLGILALWSIPGFAAVCALLRISFIRIVTANRGERHKKYEAKPLKSSPVVRALWRKELARFFGTPMYMLNCGLGSVMMIIFAVALLIKGESILKLLIGVPAVGDMIPGMIIAVMCFCALMNNTTDVSLSLEGKSFPLLKSLPVSALSVLAAKGAMNLTIGLPAIIVCAAICRYAISMDAVTTVMIFVLPCLAQLLATVWGLAANLWMPRFDWVNETLVIKQSGSAMIGIFGGMGFVALPLIVYIAALSGVMPLGTYLVLCGVFFALLCAGITAYLVTSGKKVYDEL